jgi:hypothetical protein
MKCKTAILPLVVLLLGGGGCRQEDRVAPVQSGVPNVVGSSLEDAKEMLDAAGIAYDVQAPEGQTPLIDHLWEVCAQSPAPGANASYVDLTVDREC